MILPIQFIAGNLLLISMPSPAYGMNVYTSVAGGSRALMFFSPRVFCLWSQRHSCCYWIWYSVRVAGDFHENM
jgi:hypothetical protein